MNFKIWLEMIELRKPSGKVSKKTVIKDKGTNVARSIIQFQYTTKLGNVVKLQFEPQGMRSAKAYNIIFYVNDVLYDYAPQLNAETQPEKRGRDTEILPSVFYLVKTKADKLKANYLGWHATKTSGDTKIIRNMDIEPYKRKTLQQLEIFTKEVNDYKVQMVEPSQRLIDLHAKLNKPQPSSRPDFAKEQWQSFVSKLQSSINNNEDLEEYANNLLSAEGTGLVINVRPLVIALKDFSNAVNSNTKRGYERTTNRRAAIYTRIVNRYFADEWDIEISNDRFTLSRKSKV